MLKGTGEIRGEREGEERRRGESTKEKGIWKQSGEKKGGRKKGKER